MPGCSSDAVTAREARIIKAIECYFSDVSLLRDKFLKKKIQEDDGWVTTDTFLKFKKFKVKEVSNNAQMISEALKKSSSGLMEVSEHGDKIRRSPSKPLPDYTQNRREELNARTIFAKTFPLDVKLFDLLEFFEVYGQVDHVLMKNRSQMRAFNGCVFVTFANKEDAAKFVNEEETKFKERTLEDKCFKTYYRKHKAAEGKPLKKGGYMTNEEETGADLQEIFGQKLTTNAALHLKGLNFKISREQVKAFFSKYAVLDWVDFDNGATEGYIALKEPDIASSTLEKVKSANVGKVVIQGSEIEVRVVESDEKLQYWKKVFKYIADMKKGRGRGRRQSGRNQRDEQNQRDGERNREGPQGKRKQKKKYASSEREDQDTEEPPAKVIKTEKILRRSQGQRKQKTKGCFE
ncbi:hypothetical protein BsWGS_00878 [Bradybaena similaris]